MSEVVVSSDDIQSTCHTTKLSQNWAFVNFISIGINEQAPLIFVLGIIERYNSPNHSSK